MVTSISVTGLFYLSGIFEILQLLLQDCLPSGRAGGFHLLRY